MCVLAHPDDESLGTGGTLAQYAAEGVETSLVTATSGQRGWFGEPDAYPGPDALGRMREAELRAAARVLGIHRTSLLGYCDGEFDRADPADVIAKLATHLRRERPQVVVTFGPDGAYGHPDHIAISQLTASTITCAADAAYRTPGDDPPHRVAKLYYRVWTAAELRAYQAAFGEIAIDVDGVKRDVVVWPDWAISTRLDTTAHWRTVWNAVECHRTPLPGYDALRALPEHQQEVLWGSQTYYRAMSTVNGGRGVETDLFAGIRDGKDQP